MSITYSAVAAATEAVPGAPITVTLYVIGGDVPGGFVVTPSGTGLVVDPATVPIDASGTASFTVTAAASSNYSLAFANNGAMANPANIALVIGATGYYGNQSDLEDQWGKTNIAQWSALDGSKTADVSHIQKAIDFADATINNIFRNGRYIVPLVLSSDQETVTVWFAIIAGAFLYRARWMRTESKDRKMVQEREAAVRNEMNLYLVGVRYLNASLNRHQPTGISVVNNL